MAQPRSVPTAIDHFHSIDWINENYVQNPIYEIPDFSKTLQEASTTKGYDGFFGRTLNTEFTIPHLLHLSRKNIRIPGHPSLASKVESQSSRQQLPADYVLLVSLGPEGLDGWPGFAHGGLVCSLLDSCMGYALSSYRKLLPEAIRDVPIYTGKIEVKFLAPVRTGNQNIAVLCWLTSRTEKKWITKAQIQDGQGKILAEGEGLWIMAGSGKL